MNRTSAGLADAARVLRDSRTLPPTATAPARRMDVVLVPNAVRP
jgi:hypothetical protein